MFAAMGAEPRLRIVRLLLAAHPEGMVVGEIGEELEIANSTLSHHLDKLKNEDLVEVRREGTFLRYSANTRALSELLGFCTRSAVRATRWWSRRALFAVSKLLQMKLRCEFCDVEKRSLKGETK